MNDKELNLRACIGAFADENGRTPFDIDSLDVVNHNEDCLRLLTATGISFTRIADHLIGAEAGMQQPPIEETIVDGDVLKAARQAAARVAAGWVTDADVARYSEFQSAISR